jgi:hypothetical protein
MSVSKYKYKGYCLRVNEFLLVGLDAISNRNQTCLYYDKNIKLIKENVVMNAIKFAIIIAILTMSTVSAVLLPALLYSPGIA